MIRGSSMAASGLRCTRKRVLRHALGQVWPMTKCIIVSPSSEGREDPSTSTWKIHGFGTAARGVNRTSPDFPPHRLGAAMAYYGAGRYLLLFGGFGASGFLRDTWQG